MLQHLIMYGSIVTKNEPSQGYISSRFMNSSYIAQCCIIKLSNVITPPSNTTPCFRVCALPVLAMVDNIDHAVAVYICIELQLHAVVTSQLSSWIHERRATS